MTLHRRNINKSKTNNHIFYSTALNVYIIFNVKVFACKRVFANLYHFLFYFTLKTAIILIKPVTV